MRQLLHYAGISHLPRRHHPFVGIFGTCAALLFTYLCSYYGLVRSGLPNGYLLDYQKIGAGKIAQILWTLHVPLRAIDYYYFGPPTYQVDSWDVDESEIEKKKDFEQVPFQIDGA